MTIYARDIRDEEVYKITPEEMIVTSAFREVGYQISNDQWLQYKDLYDGCLQYLVISRKDYNSTREELMSSENFDGVFEQKKV